VVALVAAFSMTGIFMLVDKNFGDGANGLCRFSDLEFRPEERAELPTLSELMTEKEIQAYEPDAQPCRTDWLRRQFADGPRHQRHLDSMRYPNCRVSTCQ